MNEEQAQQAAIILAKPANEWDTAEKQFITDMVKAGHRARLKSIRANLEQGV